jgi:dephospho-CoA kinase
VSDSKRWPTKTIIGLTGNIATGKSTIMRLAGERGALTLDADKIVHALMERSPTIREAIAEAFGRSILLDDGQIHRAALGRIVFNNPAALQRLEGIMHPAVRQAVYKYIDTFDGDVIIVEAIKLLEGELVSLCDQIWVADCTPQRQLERLLICRGMDEAAARQRISAQAPQKEKVARATVVIDTGGTMAQTEAQVAAAWDTSIGQAKPAEEAAVDAALARRARPSDVPGILLLIQRATGGSLRMKRSELLMSFADRSYFIGQLGAEMTCVMGSYVDSGITRIDQLHFHPENAVYTTAPAVLTMIEESAREHFCEIVLAFPPLNAPAAVTDWLTASGYAATPYARLHRIWQKAVDESQPPDTAIMLKVLRDIRTRA